MKKVLIITKSNDNSCIETVSKAIKEKGGTPIRFNSDLYPSEISLTSEFRDDKWRLKLIHNNEETDLSELEAIWYRRLNIAGNLSEIIDEKFLQPSMEESRRTFFGLMGSVDTFIFDYIWKVRYTDYKQLQLKVAHKLGLEIPETLISNDKNKTKTFHKTVNKEMITKMQSSFAIYEQGRENVVFTNKIEDKHLENLEELQYCPMTFQRGIDKKIELRITIVGNKVFTAAIDSQASERAKHDWRKDGIKFINSWVKYDLPSDIERKLLKLMDYYQLNYGAIDMIVTNNDKYIFLEINPVGEFFWLEENPGFPISETIADVLLNKEKRRHKRFPMECLEN